MNHYMYATLLLKRLRGMDASITGTGLDSRILQEAKQKSRRKKVRDRTYKKIKKELFIFY